MNRRIRRVLGIGAAALTSIAFLGVGLRVLADCSAFGLPFTDLGSTSFCAQIAEAYFTGLSNGTSATAYTPAQNVPREQMAAFVTRTLDKSLSRGSRRSKLQQFWNGSPRWDLGFGLTTVGTGPQLLASDGTDVWVADVGDGTVYRARTSDGSIVAHWTGMEAPYGILLALGRVFISGATGGGGIEGSLYMIDPTAAPGSATLVSRTMGLFPQAITFDGTHIWTANNGGSVSILNPSSTIPITPTTVSVGFSAPLGAIFDGSNVWITDFGDNKLEKLDASGNILQSVDVGAGPFFPAFDGTNIWVPNLNDNSVSVVRASSGAVLATLTGNGLNEPAVAAFDGQRILVTNEEGGLSLFQATTFAAIGNPVTTGMTTPFGACSDGSSFWITDSTGNQIGRY